MFLLYYWDRNFSPRVTLHRTAQANMAVLMKLMKGLWATLHCDWAERHKYFLAPIRSQRTIATVWNWCDNTISPGTPCPDLKGTKTPWISEDEGNKRDPSMLVQWQFALQSGGVGGFWKMAFLGRVGRYLNVILIKAWFFITFSLLVSSWSWSSLLLLS